MAQCPRIGIHHGAVRAGIIIVVTLTFAYLGYDQLAEQNIRIESPDKFASERSPTSAGNANTIKKAPSLSEQLQNPLATTDLDNSMKTAAMAAVRSAIVKSASQIPPFVPEGDPLLLENSSQILLYQHNSIYLWDASRGDTRKILTLEGYIFDSAALTNNGVVLLARSVNEIPSNYDRPHQIVITRDSPVPKPHEPTEYAIVVTPEGKAAYAPLSAPPRTEMQLVVLADQSILVIGGRTWGDMHVTNSIERISLTGGKLLVERLPDIPGEPRHSYAVATLGDNRMLLIGGSTSNRAECRKEECLADSYILDPLAKSWTPGPRMREGRAGASAVSLTDGAVMVIGGWTSTAGHTPKPTNSTEVWDPHGNYFVEGNPAPVATAHQRALWIANDQGMLLLIGGGTSPSIQIYDVKSELWYVAGEFCGQQDANSSDIIAPFFYKEKLFVWKSYYNSGCQHDANSRWELVSLLSAPSVQNR